MTLLSGLSLIGLSLVFALGGGAVTGVVIAGQSLGRKLAATMGAFYGPVAVLPAALAGVALLAWLR